MLREGTTALRNHFAYDKSQSVEDNDIAWAEPYFYYRLDSWALPSTESEYKKGIKFLHIYMQRLQYSDSNKEQSKFYPYAENLRIYFDAIIKRLSNMSTRLNVNATNITFYETQGSSWALLHILQGIKVDFDKIFKNKPSLFKFINKLEKEGYVMR